VTSIEIGAFYGCAGLTSIHCKSDAPIKINVHTFDNATYYSATLYVPKGTKDAYKSAEYWERFQNIVEE
jgi:hypothetical protein